MPELVRLRRPGALPLAGLLGPMALRPRAHAGVPPLPLVLRGGSSLHNARGLDGLFGVDVGYGTNEMTRGVYFYGNRVFALS